MFVLGAFYLNDRFCDPGDFWICSRVLVQVVLVVVVAAEGVEGADLMPTLTHLTVKLHVQALQANALRLRYVMKISSGMFTYQSHLTLKEFQRIHKCPPRPLGIRIG